MSADLSLNGPSTSTSSERKLRKKNHTIRDVVIVATILVTVLLWVIFSSVEFLFGNIGLIALIPILLFGSLGWVYCAAVLAGRGAQARHACLVACGSTDVVGLV